MGIHWHGTTVEVINAHHKLHLRKLIHPMDNHYFSTIVEVRDDHPQLHCHK
jgi:hypothetical protein